MHCNHRDLNSFVGLIVFCNGLDVTNEFYLDDNYLCDINNALRLSRSDASNHSVQVLFSSGKDHEFTVQSDSKLA